ncbi:hypothetical protein ACSVDA_16115 [Cytobacillus sp. Hm23]
MKKEWLIILSGPIIILITVGVILTINLYKDFKESGFSTWSHTWIPLESLRDNDAFHLSYGMKWNGVGSPIIKEITIIKSDGTALNESDRLSAIPYIYVSGSYGSLAENEERKIDTVYRDIQDYQPDKERFVLTYVLRMEEFDQSYKTTEIKKLKIKYKLFGIERVQFIDFDGFFRKIDS